MDEIFLQPGEIAFCKNPTMVTTILGSCVSVAIFDKVLKQGGICHYYLPKEYTDDQSKGYADKFRYAENALPELLKRFKNAGSKPINLEAKVIGGGDVIDFKYEKGGVVGRDNIEIALNFLKKFNIPIVAKSIGGIHGRKVRFFTHTGELQWKRVEKQERVKIKENPIKVLIVDDSKPIRKILRNMIERDSSFLVIGEAEDPLQAKEIVKTNRPDVITLDIKMPHMDGVTYLSQYMKVDPIPTIMVTSLNFDDSGPVFKALEIGAFDYVQKPALSEVDSLASELHEKLKGAYLSRNKIGTKFTGGNKRMITVSEHVLNKNIIAIGSSTGGVETIRELLINLPANIPPIVIVQHIPPVFSKAFADRLNTLCEFEVKEAEDGDELVPGRTLIAKGGQHMKIVHKGDKVVVKLTDDPHVNKFRPSVDYMFDSLTQIEGKHIIGIVLTGMGEDGAKGLLNLKNRGAKTIAQDEETSIVYGMPCAAKKMGAAEKIASIYDIPGIICSSLRA